MIDLLKSLHKLSGISEKISTIVIPATMTTAGTHASSLFPIANYLSPKIEDSGRMSTDLRKSMVLSLKLADVRTGPSILKGKRTIKDGHDNTTCFNPILCPGGHLLR